jgi:hypothetical protein
MNHLDEIVKPHLTVAYGIRLTSITTQPHLQHTKGASLGDELHAEDGVRTISRLSRIGVCSKAFQAPGSR